MTATGTLTITEFLERRITEAEKSAQDARDDELAFTSRPPYAKLGFNAGDLAQRFRPAHVLAVCAAHRRIVEMHDRPLTDGEMIDRHGYTPGELICDCGDGWPCSTLRALASIWSWHPEYRSEYQEAWR